MKSLDHAIAYNVNIAEQRIDKAEVTHTTVSDSPGAAVIGGNASQVSQTTNVSIGQGLKDLADLMRLVNEAQIQGYDQISQQLAVIRNHLAGGVNTKAEAKSAWQEVVKQAGSLANVGNNVWELVGRISQLLARPVHPDSSLVNAG